MQDNTKSGFVLPTGSWLAQERQRIGKTPADVAKAVQRHVRTVRALEQNNRVIPPGWCQDLRKLGMNVPAPAWPAPLRPYYGADLHSDLQTRVGFRHSRYWLSKQLCVTEAAVTDVIQRNRIVPSSWLLKLAELGANVPAMVRLALYHNYGVDAHHSAASAVPRASTLGHVAEPIRINPYLDRSADATASTPIPTSPAASAQRERESMYISWTEERGFHFSISAALLEQVPAVFRELLTLLTQAGQQSAKPGQSAPAARL
jgi:hypothetical protein